MLFARFHYDGLVERMMFMAVIFTDEDPQQNGVAGNLH
jgi:hypothetical protein